jgi:hypothetical protein
MQLDNSAKKLAGQITYYYVLQRTYFRKPVYFSKTTTFWDVTLCSLVEVHRNFVLSLPSGSMSESGMLALSRNVREPLLDPMTSYAR